jgi:glycerophosphoryl diester phosphodiesterase
VRVRGNENARVARTMLFAHRGASAESRENTLEAFRLAADLGADGVELDVHATSDDVLIVDHDGMLDGIPMRLCTRDAVRKGAPWVPDLADALETVSGIACNIEIKNSPFPESPLFDPEQRVARLLAEILPSTEASGIFVSSFDAAAVARLRAQRVDLESAWLTAGIPFDQALSFVLNAGHDWMNPSDAQLGDQAEEYIAAAHDAGVRIAVWTVDDPGRWSELVAAEADIVITNEVRKLRLLPAQRS